MIHVAASRLRRPEYWSKLTILNIGKMGQFGTISIPAVADLAGFHMTQTWQEAYRAAILETDWTHIQERLQTAESEIRKRQHVFSLDHGGTAEERRAIANALLGMEGLRTEVAEWQSREKPNDAATASD